MVNRGSTAAVPTQDHSDPESHQGQQGTAEQCSQATEFIRCGEMKGSSLEALQDLEWLREKD